MKANDYKELREAVQSHKKKAVIRDGVMNAIAGIGLIGFGIMMVPIFSIHKAPLSSVDSAGARSHISTAFTNISLIGRAAIVYDLSTGTILYEKNSTESLPLASLTKLLSMYAAAASLASDATITITEKALAQEGDSGLAVGEQYRLSDLGRYALVASSNDAAEAIAGAAARQTSTSNVSLLAGAAAAVGLTETHANNSTGLDVNTQTSGGYGTAEDIARLAGALLKVAPLVAHATIEPSVTIRSLAGATHSLPNTNRDIRHIPNPLLSKTGYTELAGGNLVVVYDAGINHPIAVVVLGSTREGRFADVNQLVSRTLQYFAGI